MRYKMRIKNKLKICLVLVVIVLMNGCTFLFEVRNPLQVEKEEYEEYLETGLASWYGPGFYGKKTANGEVYTGKEMTAAHRNLPFGSKVKVTRLDNGKSVIVRINDRGPFKKGYVIDLSEAAAKEIGMSKNTEVELRIIK